MKRELSYNKEARTKLLSGIDKVADAISPTLGGKGRNVVINGKNEGEPPHITKDGYSIAMSINLVDKYEDMGAQIIKEASIKTVGEVGDGTTTTTVLAQAMIHEGLAHIENGANPVDIKKGMNIAFDVAKKYIEAHAIPVKGNTKMIRQIATVSANHDTFIGELIADTIIDVGTYGQVHVQRSPTNETFVSKIEGVLLDNGAKSPYFLDPIGKICECVNPYILLCETKVMSYNSLLPILTKVNKQNRSLVIIAEDITGEAIDTLVTNYQRQGLKFFAIQVGGRTGNERTDALNDLAALTGATIISPQKGMKLETVTIEQLGGATSITMKEKFSIIKGGNGVAMKEYIEGLIKQADNHSDPFQRDYIRNERLSRLTNGLAILYVAPSTQVELREKTDRIDDAIHATKAAIKGGILAGGGIPYLHISNILKGKKYISRDVNIGKKIVESALLSPLTKILDNAGKGSELVTVFALDGNKHTFGYNVNSEQIEDFIETGIIDPALVVLNALLNAISVASMFLTTEVAIVDAVIK